MRTNRRLVSLALATCLALPLPVAAAVPAHPDLRAMSFEDLMSLEVTSVSKHREAVFDAPAAVYAITAEEIHRSGARTRPEALRLVPGVEVAQIDANKWAVSVRGFNGRFANKLLVMIDGRSVYTPLFSGVYWEMQQVLLDDVERIEVVRGPGGTLWGANAVNGVINVITKAAADTHGVLVEAGGGSADHGFGAFRYGTGNGSVDFRVYGMGFARGPFLAAPDVDAHDDWSGAQGGFRVDSNRSASDRWTLQGDVFFGEAGTAAIGGEVGAPTRLDGDLSGGNLLARWTRDVSEGTTTTLQVYYDRLSRWRGSPSEVRNTFETDFQVQLNGSRRHQAVFGATYRASADGEVGATLGNVSRTLHLFSAFGQDRITLAPERFFLTLGAKVEHNDFTGFEVQPSLRLLWTHQQRLSAWASVSRAVRTPSRGESESESELQRFIDPGTGLPGVAIFRGNPDLDAEELLAYEAGFRAHASERFFFDFAAFYNDYDELTDVRVGTPDVEFGSAGPFIVLPIAAGNVQSARGVGFEAFTRVRLCKPLQVAAGYSFLDLEMDQESFLQIGNFADISPRHQAQLRSYLDLPQSIELDAALYFNDELPGYDIDAYWRLDLRLSWHPLSNVEVSAALFNLLDASHQEFGSSSFEVPSLVPRSGYGMVRWTF
jgi:iron complex outermembrane receptor protein